MLCLLLSVNTYSLCLYVLMLLSLSQMAEQIVYYPNCRDRCSYLWCIRCRKHKSVLSVTSNTLLTGAREGIQTTYTSFRAFFFHITETPPALLFPAASTLTGSLPAPPAQRPYCLHHCCQERQEGRREGLTQASPWIRFLPPWPTDTRPGHCSPSHTLT